MHLFTLTIARGFMLVALLTSNSLGLNITSVEIPSLIRAGTTEPIVLDCKYELSKASTRGLVIKWFVNQDPLYQWIYGFKPSGSVEYKKYVDATYNVSDDPYKMFRAVKLVRPSHELSGQIKCLISTFFDEAEATRTMLVYSPAKTLRVYRPHLNKTTNRLTVTCFAEDLYPRPKIIIHQDRQPIAVQEQKFKNNSEGRYDVKATAVLEADKVKLPTVFLCEVSIPEANYTSTDEYIYNGSELFANSLIILSFNLIALNIY